MARIVIFTDLDGTLLHPKSYSFDSALPALNLIKEKKIPLVLCSSKTKAEIEVYRKRLDNKHPFISENGGGIFIPEEYFPESPSPQPSSCLSDRQAQKGEGVSDASSAHWRGTAGFIDEKYTVITLGKPYSEIRNAFIEIRKRLKIKAKGFGDMLTEDIAELTGLPLSEAMLSKARDFDEPFIFEDDNETITLFLKVIEDSGLHWTQGRFYHIIGDNDKGKAVKILKGFYKKEYGNIITIGLGDNLNDLPMLKEADYPILVRREDGSYEEKVSLPNLIKAEGIGPEGWNREVVRLINEIL